MRMVGKGIEMAMGPIAIFRSLNRDQRYAFMGSFLGWTLDAFDFFIVTFVFARIATEFKVPIPSVVFAVTITLALRPLGALIFGWLADRYGRRAPLMINIAFYSLMELLTAFSPNFTIFLLLRALYGIGMGGEWGVGAALALETLPTQARGLASGILQQGYATGFLLAAVVFWIFSSFAGADAWRGLFVIGVLPALLVLYIRAFVKESPTWTAGKAKPIAQRGALLAAFVKNPWIFISAILLMTAFNYMSHGTQDLYPTFLEKQRGFSPALRSQVTIVVQIGAIIGGSLFGYLSQQWGRKRTIVIAACGGVVAIPLWVFAPNVALLTLGGFIMQFFVQGAWGVIPAHLNELSPGNIRGTFPGFTYQLGNLTSAPAAQIEAAFATRFVLPEGGANYAEALAIIVIIVFFAVILFTLLGGERRGVEFSDA
jgi:SHS family lactate transporter-like MFS transporter